MYIKPFQVEEWMNAYEEQARYNIAETCADSVSMEELFALTGQDGEQFWRDFSARRLTYGSIEGVPGILEGICRLYKTVKPEHIVPTHGAAGANHHIFCSLLEPGDEVISIMPTYQQLYSIPEAFGARVKILELSPKDRYHLNLNDLREAVTDETKMICLNNPNNPTGALMRSDELEEVVRIAKSVGAWILCDEVYRHLTQKDEWCESITDLYEKGISVSSMSKVFSLAGLRLGWIAAKDSEALRAFRSHRDYNLISCGMFDEAVAELALANAEKLLARNRSLVRRNLSVLDEWVRNQPHVSYVKPEAGTTALVFYDLDIPSRRFCEEMFHETGAFVTPGECFGQEHCMRIGYACDTDTLKAGLKAVDQFLLHFQLQ
jgi:aspartate/methionine/tyrosine aminotransferase